MTEREIYIESTTISASNHLLGEVERLQSALSRLELNPTALSTNEIAELLRESVAVCHRLDDGIRGFTSKLDDVQKRLENEQVCRRLADERFRLAYENSPFSMSIATIAEGRFRDVNDMFLTRLGYQREEVIGKTSMELGIFTEPDGRRWLVEALATDGFVDGAETLVVGRDGEYKRARIYARVVQYNGEPCVLSITQSLEEVRRAEEEAIRLRQFYEQLLRDLPAQIAILDTAGRYLYVSPSAVTDPDTRHWLINKTDFDYCESKDIDRNIAVRRAAWLASAVEKREMVSQEERIETSKTEVRYYIRTYMPILDERGAISHVIGYGLDITAYKMLEEQLRHAQKMEAIARLAGGVAHDFNNLLTAMMGITDFMLPQVKGNATLEAGITEIQRAAERAADLTRQLLAFSRRQPTRSIPIEISKVVASLESMLRRIIGETVVLKVELEHGVPCVIGDPGQIEQIVMNLVVNARDAMPHGGELTISTNFFHATESDAPDHPLQRPGDYVRIIVRDTGFGMDAQTLRHIFEPFFTTKEEGKGTGLGLSTVYAIVERLGGRVNVESAPNLGTAFNIYLPCVAAKIALVEAGRRAVASTAGSETVLVVEDEGAVRDVVCRILTRCGYTLLEAASGEEALQLADHYSGHIDMLVSDIVMPGMSGRELALQLRARRPGVRMLFMSGHCEDIDAEFVANLDMPNFIQKPFTAAVLANKVRELLDEKKEK